MIFFKAAALNCRCFWMPTSDSEKLYSKVQTLALVSQSESSRIEKVWIIQYVERSALNINSIFNDAQE